MENIINLYCTGTKKSFLLKIPYKDIKTNLITANEYLNIRVTNKISLFDIPFDIFCIYRDEKFVFSTTKISINSEDISNQIENLESHLIEYLEIYFRDKNKMMMTKSEKSEFYFRHNIFIDENANKYFAFYKKYMSKTLICVDNYKFVYKQTNYRPTKLLDEILKIKPNKIFYATIFPFLPLNINLLILRSKLDEDFYIFLHYRAFMLYSKIYPKLSYLFIHNIIDKLKSSLNIELVDHFKSLSFNLFNLPNWLNLFRLFDDWTNKSDIIKFGMPLSKIHQDLDIPKYDITIISGNRIFKDESIIFNLENASYVNNSFIISSNMPVYINMLICEVNNQEYALPVYRNISSKEKILVNLDRFNNEDILKLTKIILPYNTLHINYEFIYIKKIFDISPDVYLDLKCKIYKIKNNKKFLYENYTETIGEDKYLFLGKGESSKLRYKIRENYYEEQQLH
ncbi:uncharacterized protein VNE69_12085 [Vairimorpha necatrix]|uniref:Uncharacterized protein n=1 Tax=Vairimorpha necatrix TaxID=6039 RepID=A0AAX4JGG2_9MICR